MSNIYFNQNTETFCFGREMVKEKHLDYLSKEYEFIEFEIYHLLGKYLSYQEENVLRIIDY